MLVEILDKVLQLIIAEEIQDEAIGDLWEYSYKLKQKKSSNILQGFLIMRYAFYLFCASIQISIDKKSEVLKRDCDRQLKNVWRQSRQLGKIKRIWLSPTLQESDADFLRKAEYLCTSAVMAKNDGKIEDEQKDEITTCARELIDLHRCSKEMTRMRQTRTLFAMSILTAISAITGLFIAVFRSENCARYMLYGSGAFLTVVSGVTGAQSVRVAGRSVAKLDSLPVRINQMEHSSNARMM